MLELQNSSASSLRVPNSAGRNLGTCAPKVTGEFLQGVPTGFAYFIRDAACAPFVDRLVGTNNDVALLLSHLRRDDTVNPGSRAHLKKWVADVWLQRTIQPVKRGAAYWQRVAAVIWEIYETARDLRHRTKRALKLEIERLGRADRRKRSKMLAARVRRKARARNHNST
jgi:hypothetical protein